jgi:oxygen-dependent protoporphyrinogen oxidase
MADVAIVGGGIAGLATAEALSAADPSLGISIFEESTGAGGKVKSELLQCGASRIVFENGPNGVLSNNPATIDLARRIGIGDRLIQASPEAKRRYIYLRGKLRKLPESPPALIRSDLISFRGKLRAAREWFVRRAPIEQVARETVSEFVTRRFGTEIVHAMIEPFVTGVFAGDPDQLELASAFPRMVELEQQYGGLLRALVAIEGEKRRARREGRPRPGTTMTSFREGMGELVAALASRLKDSLRLGAKVRSVRPVMGRWSLTFEQGGPSQNRLFDAVVLAVPAYAAAPLVEPWCPAAAREIAKIPFAPIAVVALAFEDPSARPRGFDGFGFLVARDEPLQLLGALAETSIWPRGGGGFLARVMLGGVRSPELLQLPDDQLLAIARRDLQRATGLAAEPTTTRVVRWPAAIPQYRPGHAARVAAIELEVSRFPNFALAGASYRGLSVNDICKNAQTTARQLLRAGEGRG